MDLVWIFSLLSPFWFSIKPINLINPVHDNIFKFLKYLVFRFYCIYICKTKESINRSVNKRMKNKYFGL